MKPKDAFSGQFDAFFELSVDLLGVAGFDGYFKRVNSTWEKVLGYSAEEITAFPWLDFVHPDDREATLQAGANLSEGEDILSFENRYRCKDGSYRWIHWNATSYPEQQLIFAFGRDITERKAMQEELLRSEEYFRLLVEGVLDHAIFALDTLGCVATWNAGAARFKGYSTNEIIGKHFSIFYPPQDVAEGKPERELKIARSNGKYNEEGWRVRKDGSQFWANVTITPIWDAEGQLRGYSKITRDITEHKQIQEQLRLLSMVASESLSGIVITDREIRIVYINPAFERITGHSIEEVRGCRPGDVLQGTQTDPATKKAIREAIDAKLPLTVEIVNYNKSGEPYWIEMHIAPVFDNTGEVTHFVAIENDITKRKQVEEEIRQAQERLEEAQHVACMGSWEYNLATASISWTEELFHILGLDPAQGEPDYAPHLALYHPDDAALLDACVHRAITEGAAYELDLRRVVSEGTPMRWYHAVGRPLRDAHGNVTRLVGTLQNITERKRVEHQLEAAKEWLEEANQHLEATNGQLEYQILRVNEQATELEVHKAELEEANRRLTALAITDGLTGLNNHRAFQEKLAEEFERTQRYSIPMSAILLDVDKFKTYNDTFGHPEGDVVLKTVAKILQETARDTDYICRYGGEEFVIILPNTTAQGAIEAAERFRAAIEKQPWTLRPITASFGVSSLQATLTTAQDLVTQADEALYASKKQGRNRVTHFAHISQPEGLGDQASAAREQSCPLAA